MAMVKPWYLYCDIQKLVNGMFTPHNLVPQVLILFVG